MDREERLVYRFASSDAAVPVFAIASGRNAIRLSTELDLDVHSSEPAAQYRPSAIVPRERWRPVDGWETCASSRDECGKLFLAVVPGPFVSGRLQEIAAEVNEAIVTALSSGIPPVFSDIVRDAECQLIQWAASINPQREIFPIGFNTNRPGRRSVTVDREGYRLGLHLDSWDGPGLAGREARTNRVSMNFGPGQRHFYAIPIPVWTMRQTLAAEGPLDVSKIIDDYMRLPIEHTVVRLTVPPGAVYVAPTECLVHDGSTIDSDDYCVTYSIRGHFTSSFRYWQ